jgi:hypothetical protein
VSTPDLNVFQEIKLSTFDCNTIRGLVARGGETAWIPQGKPEWLLKAIESMVERRLIQIIERVPAGLFIRLLDAGRYCATQIEASDKAAEKAQHRNIISG